MYVWARVSLLDCGDASIKEGYGRGHPYWCETLWGYILTPRWGLWVWMMLCNRGSRPCLLSGAPMGLVGVGDAVTGAHAPAYYLAPRWGL